MDKETRAIWVENGLIILAIAALWPAILRWPGAVTLPVLVVALAAMVIIFHRRWRRLMHNDTIRCHPEGNEGSNKRGDSSLRSE
ncbi:MAG: hypothetical protein V2A65_01965 [Candidatus Omnitrophota bacterium]